MFEFQEEMQTKIAFLEKATNDLSDVVYRQQQDIDGLKQRLQMLIERLAAAGGDDAPRVIEDERPPHY